MVCLLIGAGLNGLLIDGDLKTDLLVNENLGVVLTGVGILILGVLNFEVPDGFIFSLKASRFTTNRKVLADVDQGKRFRCVEYSVVLAEVFQAMGYPARIVALKKDGMSYGVGKGHVITEAWNDELGKWIAFDGQNNATLVFNECRLANCPPVAPGQAFPAQAALSDQKAGSVLVFPFYSSDPTALHRENTRISLTNTHPLRRAAVHLFFVEEDSSNVADAYVCLTANQTASFMISDLDPGVAGYLIAVATDDQLGCPVNFNYLLGDEFVKLSSGHVANLPAEAFAALIGAPATCDSQTNTVELKFDGLQYNAAPRTLALDSLPSPVDGNATLLILDRFGGNLASGLNTLGAIAGLLYDDQEASFSFEFSTTRRQFRSLINGNFPRTAPRVPNLIPTGRSGWLKVSRGTDGAILGAVINFNPNTASASSAFTQGHNLHKLTLTNEATLIVPVFPPGC